MENFKERGLKIRELFKELVMDFMKNNLNCAKESEGMTQAELFRLCGFDFGEYPSVSSSNQQYWVAAVLQELRQEGKVVRLPSKKWRLVN